jgi:hypothetical protein
MSSSVLSNAFVNLHFLNDCAFFFFFFFCDLIQTHYAISEADGLFTLPEGGSERVSHSKLYRLSDHRLLAKFVPTLPIKVLRGQRSGFPRQYSSFLDQSRYYFFQIAPQLYSRSRVTPFKTHNFSENLVVPGIEPGNQAMYSSLN